jgi:predicted nucleic acid-binding protein
VSLIVDASVVIKWFVEESLHAEARHIYKYQRDILAPDFVLVEVANVAWKKVQRQEIKTEQAYEIINLAFEALPGFVHSSDVLPQAAKLAIELVHPVYDCLYLACVDGPQDSLVTGDKRFFNKVKDTRFGNSVHFLDDPDLALPLHIPLYKIHQIIGLSDLIEETHRNLVSALTENREFVIYNTSELQPLLDSPTYRRLKAAIESLSDAEQADILALGWLGRGYDGQEWDSIREHAGNSIKGNDKRYLSYVGSMAIYVEQGLATLRNSP